MRTLRLFLLILLSLGMSIAAQGAVTASLSKSRISVGETVQLVLQQDARSSSQPDLSPLERDFKILGTSSGSSIQIINGQVFTKSELRINLAPKHEGTLQVPSLQWDGDSSQALEVTVSDKATPSQPAAAAATGNAAHVFLDMTLEPKQPFVDESAVLTVRLFYDEPLYQASLDLAPNNNVKIQQLGQDQQSNESRNGISYQVVERQYLLFPQRSGHFTLNGPVLNAQVVDTSSDDSLGTDPFFNNVFSQAQLAGMMNATRPLRLQGKAIDLDVRPRPAGVASQDWLPASSLSLDESWQPDNATIHVGDPLTRHLHLHAEGTTAAQLPDLSTLMPLPDGVKSYPDQTKLDTQAVAGRLLANRDQDIALIASRPGHYTLPGVRLSWWDVKQNASRTVMLPARILNVLPAVGGASVSPLQALGKIKTASLGNGEVTPIPRGSVMPESNPWRWVSLILAMFWLGTLAAWWRQRKSTVKISGAQPKTVTAEKPASSSAAMRAFQQSARENDPQASRQHLLAWARATWAQDPPPGLQALSGRLQDPTLHSLLEQLDRACYTRTEWLGSTLAEALKKWRGDVKDTKSDRDIPDLYA